MDTKFPSPCGDKLKYYVRVPESSNNGGFPSPCGDKLKSSLSAISAAGSSFRPLAGRTLSVTAYAVPAPPKGELNIWVIGSCKSSPFGRAGAQRLRGFAGIS